MPIPMVKDRRERFFIYQVAAIAAIGGVLFGFDTGIISGALVFIKNNFKPTTLKLELIVSSVVFGALIGAIISGHLADIFGRKRLLFNTALLFILGTIAATFARHINTLIAGRLILGLAVGMASYIVPLFIAEMAPAKLRGSLVLLNAIAITGGQAAAFLVDYILVHTHSWRLMFATSFIPALLLLLGILFVPETPRWLVLKGKLEDAKQTLIKIRNSLQIDAELNDIKEKLNLKLGGWKELFSKITRPVLFVGLGLGILQQFVGINTVMYYGPTIFHTAGFQSTAADVLATFGMGLVNTLMSIISVFIVDKLGRRQLLLGGLTVATLSLAIVGIIFHINANSIWSRWIALIALVTYIAGYSISIGNLFWLIISEIYPLRIRGLAMSFVTAVQWGANFIVAMSFLTIVHTFGPAITFWLYGCMCLFGIIFTFYFVPETKGISLEQIELNLQAGKPTKQLGMYLTQDSRIGKYIL